MIYKPETFFHFKFSERLKNYLKKVLTQEFLRHLHPNFREAFFSSLLAPLESDLSDCRRLRESGRSLHLLRGHVRGCERDHDHDRCENGRDLWWYRIDELDTYLIFLNQSFKVLQKETTIINKTLEQVPPELH